MSLGALLEEMLDGELPVAVAAFDGSRVGPADAPATITIRSPEALRRVMAAGELGFAQAYISGEIDLDGDVYSALAIRDLVSTLRPDRAPVTQLMREMRAWQRTQRPARPSEVRLNGERHSITRDRRAVTHHYDVSAAFYELVLDPSLTYTCALFETPDDTLEQAQWNKRELVCRKLGLSEGDRLLDMGCGWGGMAIHAAERFGVHAVAVTVAENQVEMATRRAAEAGVADRIEVRLQDYREVADGPFDAVSSIGMFEHVGSEKLVEYFSHIHSLLRPGGRLLNHGISRSPGGQNGRRSRTSATDHYFTSRYLFPDGETYDVGEAVAAMQKAGLELRHAESLREHYVLTLRQWVANLEKHWDEAVAVTDPAWVRSWYLFMASGAMNFAAGGNNIHQCLAVRQEADGASAFSLRPAMDLH